MSSMSPVGTDNWYEELMRFTWELEMLGASLGAIVDPQETSHLQHRLLDAINWFGDAATDANRSSSIVKYISSIERLLFGSFELGRKKSFARRVSSVLKAFGCDDDGKVHQQASIVYETRSALVHGEYRETAEELDEAAGLSRMCLLCSLRLYLLMKRVFGSPDPTKLEEVMKRIVEEGVDWLLEAAGNPETDVIG